MEYESLHRNPNLWPSQVDQYISTMEPMEKVWSMAIHSYLFVWYLIIDVPYTTHMAMIYFPYTKSLFQTECDMKWNFMGWPTAMGYIGYYRVYVWPWLRNQFTGDTYHICLAYCPGLQAYVSGDIPTKYGQTYGTNAPPL